MVAPPLLCGSGEINKTKPNITIPNITTSTELKSSAFEEDESASLFLNLKEKCLLELQNEYALDENKIDLVDRALDNLWSKDELSHEGRAYTREELKKALLERLSSRVVVTALSYLESASEPIRLPVAYLSKCILGALVSPEKTALKTHSDGIYGSFDIDDFFEAAMKRSYSG